MFHAHKPRTYTLLQAEPNLDGDVDTYHHRRDYKSCTKGFVCGSSLQCNINDFRVVDTEYLSLSSNSLSSATATGRL